MWEPMPARIEGQSSKNEEKTCKFDESRVFVFELSDRHQQGASLNFLKQKHGRSMHKRENSRLKFNVRGGASDEGHAAPEESNRPMWVDA